MSREFMTKTDKWVPVVRRAKIEKGLLGGYRAEYKCPHCKCEMKSDEADLGKLRDCPSCGGTMGLSVRILNQVIHKRLMLAAIKIRDSNDQRAVTTTEANDMQAVFDKSISKVRASEVQSKREQLRTTA